ncbi:MAG: DUF4760 domain-containing protein [Anaerolineales bacterium]
MKNKEFSKTIWTSILISIFSFIALIFLSSFWKDNTLESISTAVAAAAVFGAAYIAYQELQEVANTRYMDIADRLFGELNSPENVEARRHIFQNLKDDPEQGLKRLKGADQDAMKKVLNSLDRVAFLTRAGWISDDLIMPWMHPMIAKSWEKLEPYVMYERERRNEPYYYEHAGDLAERCRRWRAKHLAETDTKWVENAL